MGSSAAGQVLHDLAHALLKVVEPEARCLPLCFFSESRPQLGVLDCSPGFRDALLPAMQVQPSRSCPTTSVRPPRPTTIGIHPAAIASPVLIPKCSISSGLSCSEKLIPVACQKMLARPRISSSSSGVPASSGTQP